MEQVMTEKGVSKVELARRLDIKPQNVNSAISTENLSKLRHIADVLGCEFSELIDDVKTTCEINGFVEVEGVIYRISNISDYYKLGTIIEQKANTNNGEV
ncbi:MAG: helix-turn-helix transcriptional regulator [Bacteroidales bacterium]|nr:helix-turn-helix transcriptional regulator [Bacteroidales bacterium]